MRWWRCWLRCGLLSWLLVALHGFPLFFLGKVELVGMHLLQNASDMANLFALPHLLPLAFLSVPFFPCSVYSPFIHIFLLSPILSHLNWKCKATVCEWAGDGRNPAPGSLVTCRTSCGAVCADAVPGETELFRNCWQGCSACSTSVELHWVLPSLGISVTWGASGLSVHVPSVAQVTLAGKGVIRWTGAW